MPISLHYLRGLLAMPADTDEYDEEGDEAITYTDDQVLSAVRLRLADIAASPWAGGSGHTLIANDPIQPAQILLALALAIESDGDWLPIAALKRALATLEVTPAPPQIRNRFSRPASPEEIDAMRAKASAEYEVRAHTVALAECLRRRLAL